MSAVFFWEKPPLKNSFPVWIFLLYFKPTDQTTIGACLVLSRLLITFSAKPCLTLGLLEGDFLWSFTKKTFSAAQQFLYIWAAVVRLGRVGKSNFVQMSNCSLQQCLPSSLSSTFEQSSIQGILSIILLEGGKSNVDLMISNLLLKQSGFKSVWCYHLQRCFSC